jgi:VWFA-related protein
MNKRVTLALLLSVCTLLPALGQTTPTADKADKDDDVVKITTNLVQVDAVVTKDGKPVTGLSADDFEIYEDGRKQAITSFAYISNVAGNAASANASRPKASSSDKTIANAPPPQPIQRDVARRTIAVVVDDLGISAESMKQIKYRLRKFIAEELQPNDLVAVIRTGGDVGALQQFTTDKRVLTRAVDQLRWNVCSRMGNTVLGRVESVGENHCHYDSPLRTMKALRFILDSMGRLPGRKSMVLISDNVPIATEESNTPGLGIVTDEDTMRTGPHKDDGFGIVQVGQSVRNYGSWLRRITETAIRSSVVIYSIDTQGLQYTGITAADAVFERIPESNPRINGLLRQRFRTLQINREGGYILAKQTGGFQVTNSNGFQFDRILEDQSGYYLLGYRPTEETFNRQFHQIKAKVKRSGMTLRTRYGFFGVSEEEANRGRLSTRDQMTLALISPFAEQNLELEVNSFFASGNSEGSIIRSFLYLNPANLSFVPGNGRYETALEIQGAIFGDNGSIVEKVKHDVVLSLGENEYQQAMRDGLPDAVRLRFDMPAKKPGSYQVRIAVRDRTSAKIGSAGQFIEVPDLNNKRVALSGIMLRGGAAATTAATVMATPPGTRFPVNSDLHFAFFVYNATPDLVLQTRLFRDGKIVKANDDAAIDVTNKDNLGRTLVTNVMRLTPELEPGAYYLQVVIADKTAKDKKSAVSQWADFEIVK